MFQLWFRHIPATTLTNVTIAIKVIHNHQHLGTNKWRYRLDWFLTCMLMYDGPTSHNVPHSNEYHNNRHLASYQQMNAITTRSLKSLAGSWTASWGKLHDQGDHNGADFQVVQCWLTILALNCATARNSAVGRRPKSGCSIPTPGSNEAYHDRCQTDAIRHGRIDRRFQIAGFSTSQHDRRVRQRRAVVFFARMITPLMI